MTFRQLALVAVTSLLLAATPVVAQPRGGVSPAFPGSGVPVAPVFRGGNPVPLNRGLDNGMYYRSYSPAYFGQNFPSPPYGLNFPATDTRLPSGLALGLSRWEYPTTYFYVVGSAPVALAAVVGTAGPIVPYASVRPRRAPVVPTPAATPTLTSNAPVYIDVKAPAGAQVWLGPTLSNQTGEVRSFVSPPLDPAVEYFYLVRAQWIENGQPVSREKKVPVRAGERITVDLTQR